MSFTNSLQVLPDAVGGSINSAEIEDGAILLADLNASTISSIKLLSRQTVGGATPYLYPTTDGDNLRINSLTTSPNANQFGVKAHNEGFIGFLGQGQTYQEVDFNAEFIGGEYIARSTQVSKIVSPQGNGLEFIPIGTKP